VVVVVEVVVEYKHEMMERCHGHINPVFTTTTTTTTTTTIVIIIIILFYCFFPIINKSCAGKEIVSLWLEYEDGATPEGRVVKDFDK